MVKKNPYIYFHQDKSKMRHKIQNQNPDFKNITLDSNSENYTFEKDGLQLKSKYTSEDVKIIDVHSGFDSGSYVFQTVG